MISSALSIPFDTSFVYLQPAHHNSHAVRTQTHYTFHCVHVTYDEGAFLATAVPIEGSSKRQVFSE